MYIHMHFFFTSIPLDRWKLFGREKKKKLYILISTLKKKKDGGKRGKQEAKADFRHK